MRYLIYLSNARLPTEKANGYQIMKTCQALAREGIRVTLVFPRRRQRQPSTEQLDPWTYYGIEPVFSLMSLPTLDLNGITPGWFKVQVASHIIATLTYTVPSWRHNDIAFYGRDQFSLAALLTLRPFIKARLFYEAHVFPSTYASWLLPLLMKLDGLAVLTHHLKDRFIKAGMPKSKIVVAPDAVDLEEFQISSSRLECRRRLGLPHDRFIIGYIGRFQTMEMEKGIPELIQALKLLIDRFPEISPLLLCVGGPMESVPRYRAIAQNCGVPVENLIFKDRVPNRDVPFWMRACNVGTIPWPWTDFSAYYTSPMKLFEYMAADVPIIASNLPSLREVLNDGENAILVKPGDPTDLAEKISCIITDEAVGRKIAIKALEDVKAFTWKARADTILSLLA